LLILSCGCKSLLYNAQTVSLQTPIVGACEPDVTALCNVSILSNDKEPPEAVLVAFNVV